MIFNYDFVECKDTIFSGMAIQYHKNHISCDYQLMRISIKQSFVPFSFAAAHYCSGKTACKNIDTTDKSTIAPLSKVFYKLGPNILQAL
jgi:hypothetical protein